MKQTPERELHAEEGPPPMNNFLCYLPGGAYSGEVYDILPKQEKVVAAINKLLKGEFTSIDLAIISKKQNEIRALNNKALGGEGFEDLSDEDFEEIYRRVGQLSTEIDEEIRPLFDRLIEMGFDYSLLVA